VLSELELIEPYLPSQRSNPPRPLWQGRRHELSGPGHSCLQDTKSLHILRCAHRNHRNHRSTAPWAGAEGSRFKLEPSTG
jgi:hypothetical protein